MAKVKRLVGGYDIEVWSGERFVARMEPSRSKAISVGGIRPAFAVNGLGEVEPLLAGRSDAGKRLPGRDLKNSFEVLETGSRFSSF
jgi:hypothetical protein